MREKSKKSNKRTEENNCVLNHPTYSEGLVIIYGVISFILFLM